MPKSAHSVEGASEIRRREPGAPHSRPLGIADGEARSELGREEDPMMHGFIVSLPRAPSPLVSAPPRPLWKTAPVETPRPPVSQTPIPVSRAPPPPPPPEPSRDRYVMRNVPRSRHIDPARGERGRGRRAWRWGGRGGRVAGSICHGRRGREPTY
jgi:hypothetical protein